MLNTEQIFKLLFSTYATFIIVNRGQIWLMNQAVAAAAATATTTTTTGWAEAYKCQVSGVQLTNLI